MGNYIKNYKGFREQLIREYVNTDMSVELTVNVKKDFINFIEQLIEQHELDLSVQDILIIYYTYRFNHPSPNYREEFMEWFNKKLGYLSTLGSEEGEDDEFGIEEVGENEYTYEFDYIKDGQTRSKNITITGYSDEDKAELAKKAEEELKKQVGGDIEVVKSNLFSIEWDK